MRKICPKCGVAEHELALYCSFCAARLDDEATSQDSTWIASLKELGGASVFFRLAVSAALVAAIFPQPYSYFSFLRIGTFLVCSYAIVVSIKSSKFPWIIGFGFIALVFNPLAPLKEIDQETWKYIDLASAAILLISILFVGEKIKAKGTWVSRLPISRQSRFVTAVVVCGLVLAAGVFIGIGYSDQKRNERERGAEANKAVANAMNAAANAANAAALAAQRAAETMAKAANVASSSLSNSIPNESNPVILARRIKTPAGLNEFAENKNAEVLAIDLNGDGVDEYIGIVGMCGSGGCELGVFKRIDGGFRNIFDGTELLMPDPAPPTDSNWKPRYRYTGGPSSTLGYADLNLVWSATRIEKFKFDGTNYRLAP